MMILLVGILTFVSLNYVSFYFKVKNNPKELSLIGWRNK